jgi:hypothetical protein
VDLFSSDAGGSSPGPGDPVWDCCDWLADVRDVPSNAVWPRLMTGPHPAAVGSYGQDAIGWVAEHDGPLRWFQRLLFLRSLEHDAVGRLVWLVLLWTLARQVGKSVGLRGYLSWRMHQAERFGEPQTVMHTGKDLQVCSSVQAPARAWARARKAEGYEARRGIGMQEIVAPDGSRWLVRSKDAVYGYSAGLGAVDEAWDVPPEIVDEGLEPTMPERVSPQLLLVSTAHGRATPLMVNRRLAALRELDAPRDTLLVEWSAQPGTDVEDRDGWRAASPHWTAQRERLLASKLARADSEDADEPVGSFRTQWLNQWPTRVLSRAADDVLLEDGVWAGAVSLSGHADGPLVVAVEDRTGLGAAAAACGRDQHGRLLVWGQLFPDRAAAAGWAQLLMSGRRGSRLLVGASLAGDAVFGQVGVPADTAGAAETGRGLAKLRELLTAGELCHDGGTALAAQVGAARVTERAGGLVLTPGARTDLLRCAAWTVWAAAAAPATKPKWAVF